MQVILEIAIDPPGTRYRKSISGAEIGFNAKSYRAAGWLRVQGRTRTRHRCGIRFLTVPRLAEAHAVFPDLSDWVCSCRRVRARVRDGCD